MSSSDRLRSFFAPTTGDRLLSQATSCKFELHRYEPEPLLPDDDACAEAPRESVVELSYELRGELPLKGREAGELLVGLVRQFQRPRSSRREGGDA